MQYESTDDNFVCNKCLKEDYELVKGNYVLKSDYVA
jgi:hypothetical protein